MFSVGRYGSDMSPTLLQLRYFVAVADHLHFTRAAEAMRVSQPSLSAQVSALERLLGVTLFDRTTRRVTLTPAGQRLHERLVPILADLDRAVGDARRPEHGEPIRVAYTASVGFRVIPLLLDEVRRRGRSLEADQARHSDVLSAVRSGRVDAGLVREAEAEPGLRMVTLLREPVAAFLSESHELAGRSTLSGGDLEGQHLLCVPPSFSPGFLRLIQRLVAAHGLDVQVTDLTVPDAREALYARLANDAGLMFLGPVSMTTSSWEGVTHRPVDDPDATFSIDLVVADGRPSEAVRTVESACEAVSARA